MLVSLSCASGMTNDHDASPSSSPSNDGPKRRPGRPPTYVFSKPDSELSENERRLKGAVIKRRQRQNRSYHRKKQLKQLSDQAAKSAAAAAAAAASSTETTDTLPHPGMVHPAIPPLNFSPGPQIGSSHAFPHGQGLPLPVLTPLTGHAPTSSFLSSPMPTGVAHSSLSYLSRMTRPNPQTSTHGTLSSAAAPLPSTETRLPASLLTADLNSMGSPEKLLSTTYFNPSPRFDGSMIQGPTSNVEVRVENSGGMPFLSIGAPRVNPKSNKHGSNETDVGDEDQLLDEILQASQHATQKIITSRVPRRPEPGALLSQDLDIRLASLPRKALDSLKHLVLFPASFSPESALHVMGLSPDEVICTEIFKPLVDLKLFKVLPSGRYELNDIAKNFFGSTTFEDAQAARQRFMSHFTTKLRSLGTNSLSQKGDHRLKAMKMYDQESQNMRVALQMCDDIGGRRLLIDVLAQAATVMRYSVCARERTEIFREVLADGSHGVAVDSKRNESEARLLLALAEAHFDLLDFNEAEVYLGRAIGMMAGNEVISLPVSSSVLALLLLAELRVSSQENEEAKKLLTQALKSLNEADLQRSTFAVCCLLTLASVYTSTKQFDSSLLSVNAALEILTDLGYCQLPIYADALGTLGMVHFGKGNIQQAQTLFFSALSIIQTWMSRKDWESAPFHHCAHLDIFLVENIARTYITQGRHEEAGPLFERTRQQRRERQLAVDDPISSDEETVRLERGRLRTYTRHLY